MAGGVLTALLNYSNNLRRKQTLGQGEKNPGADSEARITLHCLKHVYIAREDFPACRAILFGSNLILARCGSA